MKCHQSPASGVVASGHGRARKDQPVRFSEHPEYDHDTFLQRVGDLKVVGLDVCHGYDNLTFGEYASVNLHVIHEAHRRALNLRAVEEYDMLINGNYGKYLKT